MRYNHILRSNRITSKIFGQQEQLLKDRGECKGIIGKQGSTEVYYTYNGSAFRVLYENDILSRITKISVDEMNRLLTCADLKFGD